MFVPSLMRTAMFIFVLFFVFAVCVCVCVCFFSSFYLYVSFSLLGLFSFLLSFLLFLLFLPPPPSLFSSSLFFFLFSVFAVVVVDAFGFLVCLSSFFLFSFGPPHSPSNKKCVCVCVCVCVFCCFFHPSHRHTVAICNCPGKIRSPPV